MGLQSGTEYRVPMPGGVEARAAVVSPGFHTPKIEV